MTEVDPYSESVAVLAWRFELAIEQWLRGRSAVVFYLLYSGFVSDTYSTNVASEFGYVLDCFHVLPNPTDAMRKLPHCTHVLVASLSDAKRQTEHFTCDLCGAVIEGEPAGKGFLVWARGDDLRVEEPPLCESCAPAIAVEADRRRTLSESEE